MSFYCRQHQSALKLAPCDDMLNLYSCYFITIIKILNIGGWPAGMMAMIGMFNSIANNIIYAVMNKDIYKTYRTILRIRKN